MIDRFVKWGLCVGLLGLALAPVAVPDAPAAEGDGLAAREWNQPRGNALRSGHVALKPVGSQPVDAWKLDFDRIHGNPVTWGGTLFVAADGDLIALDPVTGAERGRKKLRLKTDVELASWQGKVVIGDLGVLRSFTWLGTKFKNGWTKRGKWARGIGVHNGMLLAPAQGGGIHAIQFSNGKQSKVPAEGTGMAAAETVDGKTTIYAADVGPRGQEKKDRLRLIKSTLTLDRSKTPSFQVSLRSWLKTVSGEGPVTVAITRETTSDGDNNACLVRTTRCNAGALSQTGTHVSDADPNSGKPSPVVFAPVGRKGKILGFTSKGSLIRINAKGNSDAVVKAEGLPKGAGPFAATGAGNLVFFGNWALDIDNRRILWSRPDLKPKGPAIPVADGMLVLVTQDNALVGLADPAIVKVIAAASGGKTSGPSREEVPRRKVTLPDDRDGVLMVDGRFVLGSFELLPRTLKVQPEGDGEEFEIPEEKVLVAQEDGEIMHRGSEFEVFELWRDGLEDLHVNALVEIYEACIKAGLINEAAGYLQQTRDFNIENARATELQARLTGKRQHPNSKTRLKKVAEQETAARAKGHAAALNGADWCAKREFLTAATVLLTIAERIRPGSPEIAKRATQYIPEEYPWKGQTRADKMWMTWAQEILPADAKFCAKDDPAWSRARNQPWQDKKGTLLFRSNNLLFFTRSKDPAVIGACLRNGEGSVKTLRVLLGVGDEDRVTSDKKRLDVRVHTDRASYLNETLPGGGKPIPWSAGFYTPRENVSRFYVSQRGDPNESGRDLYKTLVHELTHHYVEMRWMPHYGSTHGGGATQPGHWVVEGFARFVEDQTIEISRRGVRFDDPTVASVDCIVQLHTLDKLMNAAELVDSDYTKFMALPKGVIARVKLANTFEAYLVDARKRYYDQAGALVYFMINARGEKGRKLFIAYLKARYMGRLKKPSWRDLGFESGEQLDEAFRAFLKTLAK